MGYKDMRTDSGRKKTDTRLYSIWENMKARCYNKNKPKYKTYGAKGIRVCKEWKESFDSFHDWAVSHGYRDSLTLDRKDPKGNYEPSNCRWASNKVQANNKRNSRNRDGKDREYIEAAYTAAKDMYSSRLASRSPSRNNPGSQGRMDALEECRSGIARNGMINR